jgi:hypothetical protein
MKKILIMGVFLLMVLAVSCLADSVSVSPSSVTIGNDNTRRSNPDADDEENQIVYESATFTVTNVLNQPVDITSITFPTDFKYNISVSDTSFSLAAANATSGTKSKTISIRSIIPEDLPSFFDNNPKQVADQIGNIVVQGAGLDPATVPLYLEAENYLQISKVYVSVNGGARKSYDNGDDVKDIRPGDTIQITVKVENRYRSHDPEDLNFDDADVSLDALDSDISDLEDSDSISVDSDSTEELDFDAVTLDDSIDRGSYDLQITLSGEDDNGAYQGDQWTLTFKIVQDTNEIAIRNFDSQIDLTCGQKLFEVPFTLVNIGRDDQDQTAVRVYSTDFGYDQRQQDLDLSAGDEEDFTFSVPVPADITPGIKTVNIVSFYDNTKQSHAEYITVIVPNCAPTPTPTPTPSKTAETTQEEEPPVVIQPGTQQEEYQNPVIAGEEVYQSTEPQFFGSTGYLVVLVLAIVITLACIIVLVVVLLRVNRPKV